MSIIISHKSPAIGAQASAEMVARRGIAHEIENKEMSWRISRKAQILTMSGICVIKILSIFWRQWLNRHRRENDEAVLKMRERSETR